MGDIERLICQYFKVDPLIMRSKSRKKIHTYPRSIYLYLCRHHTGATLEDIAKSVERNHSTVLYASEAIEHKMKTDTKVKREVEFLTQKMKDMTK
jgi:chromosomal replication initiator protein